MSTDLISAPTVEDKSRDDTSVDRSRVVQIDCESYLVIGPDGEYTTSNVPEELPQGFVVDAMIDDIKGQRQFIITRNASYPYDESDTYDDVKVGTLMIQNGYAYTAGKVICGEEPKFKMTKIWIPPFVMTYPVLEVLSKLRDEDELYFVYQDRIRANLERSIMTHNDIQVNHHCLEFDMNRPLNLSQEYRCQKCGLEMTEAGYDFCEACVYQEDTETDEDMDTYDGEDDFEGLLEKLDSKLDIGPSKQN